MTDLARACPRRSHTRGLDPEGYVSATASGAKLGPDNFRNRVMGPAVKRANEKRTKVNEPPLPDRLTPHSLRRTFASVLYALGDGPPDEMEEMGHADPGPALKVYAQAMRLDAAERAKLAELVGGFRHGIGTNEPGAAPEPVEQQAA